MENKLMHHLLWERLRIGDHDAFFDLYREIYYDLVNFGINDQYPILAAYQHDAGFL